jgi:hypothetical protein
MIPKGADTNTFINLDILELRTPLRTDAARLIAGPEVNGATSSTSTGVTAAGSFAILPWEADKYFKEEADFKVSVNYPSRIDKLSRLTVCWTDPTGVPLADLGENAFILRFVTTLVPTEPERMASLPKPVELELDQAEITREKMIRGGVTAALLIGLLVILVMARR